MRAWGAPFLLPPVFYNESRGKIFFIAVLLMFLLGVGAWYYYERTFAPAPAGEPSDSGINQSKGMPVIGGAGVQEILVTETVQFQTADGVTIFGLYTHGDNSARPAVLLSHMMPATKESWSDFAQELADAGFRVLAIDLRGHGESVVQTINNEYPPARDALVGKTLNYKNFTDSEHQKSILDLEAAIGFLKSKGASEIHLVGASIGANLSLQYLAEHSDARSAILLSPGLDYRGVKTDEFAVRLRTGQAAYFVAANDGPYSAQTAKTLVQKTPDDAKKELKIFKHGGHGTDIFSAHLELMRELSVWLKQV